MFGGSVMSKSLRLLLSAACVGAVAATASAGIISPAPTSADGPSFAPGFVIASPVDGSPQVPMTVNQQASAGISQTQTFVTGPAGFTLDRIDIYSGGKAGGTGRLNI